MFSALARLTSRVVPPAPGLWRGLAWKTNSRPTRDELIKGSRKSWNPRRQLVPDRVRIPLDKWKLVVGDQVEVIEGKHRGARGEVLVNSYLENRVVVSGVNMQTKNRKMTSQEKTETADALAKEGKKPETRTEKKPGPIHYSDVALINPSTGKRTRVTVRRDARGKLVRVASGSENVIVDWPAQKKPTRPTATNAPQDTDAGAAHEVTYERHGDFLKRYRFT
jgi:large subunit ribosomal protein L24